MMVETVRLLVQQENNGGCSSNQIFEYAKHRAWMANSRAIVLHSLELVKIRISYTMIFLHLEAIDNVLDIIFVSIETYQQLS